MAGGWFTAANYKPTGKVKVCVIGSGAGGAIVADQLAGAGLDVVVLEEGGRYTKADFKMREDLAYPQLYQEAGGRTTKDLSMTLLQGRAVGGTTVINFTTCFRTPDHVLEHWRKVHAVEGFAKKDLGPHWDAVESRLNIQPIAIDESNRNNRLLYDGCTALGLTCEPTSRNTRACFKSGYCSMGCPVDAKQSMLVTYLPDAIEKGASVVSRARVDRLKTSGERIVAAEISELSDDGYTATGRTMSIEADYFVLSAGAIGTPAILIRSGLGGGMVGRRTFVHPVVGITGVYQEEVRPFYGAPQSMASHALADRGDKVGLFLEAAPVHPMIAALATSGFGEEHRAKMISLANTSAHVALAIDGFHPSEQGGTVELKPSGAPVLDYVIPERIWEALREGAKTLARINLAAGALRAFTGHDPAVLVEKEADLKKIEEAPFEANRVAVFSAHIMGGAMMSDDPTRSVVRSTDLRHHTVTNLHVVDGSVFPTSLGVNPSETIYGLAHLMGARLATAWKTA